MAEGDREHRLALLRELSTARLAAKAITFANMRDDSLREIQRALRSVEDYNLWLDLIAEEVARRA